MRRVLTGLGLAAAVALCGTGTWSYAQARGDDDLAYARARDAALDDGRAAVAALSTLDASSTARAKAGIGTWKSVTSGPLRTDLSRLAPASGPSSRATVTDAALTALDDHAGTAKLIATLRVETTPKGAKTPTTDRKRLEATLSRASDGTWKVRALNAIPVTAVGG
ncbi:hypothetical protein [Streptomyces xanthii]|uniref:Secreted protein n=1 Tax=Streptomyces xanthii TaxID=2768069 RepID=A0A7H1BCP5_9ACTN|nr:hypothetical protein [Streptomyces xanthii]QNS06500.1 hypothetical protein IAG42_24890 [Streptomyces xanthii]